MNLAKAIACYEAALRVRTEHDFPVYWAMTQSNLGAAYCDLLIGDRAENGARGIACFEAALRVYNERDFPVDWARTMENLAIARKHLPTGKRAENLEKAIACYEAAARGYSAAGLAEEAEKARRAAATLATNSR
jgi:tetratricopeptide (TPR) repeat protein